jgi:hypothetical protein
MAMPFSPVRKNSAGKEDVVDAGEVSSYVIIINYIIHLFYYKINIKGEY